MRNIFKRSAGPDVSWLDSADRRTARSSDTARTVQETRTERTKGKLELALGKTVAASLIATGVMSGIATYSDTVEGIHLRTPSVSDRTLPGEVSYTDNTQARRNAVKNNERKVVTSIEVPQEYARTFLPKDDNSKHEEVLRTFVNKAREVKSQNTSGMQIDIVGGASDEDLSVGGIMANVGTPSKNNERLALKRAENVKKALAKVADIPVNSVIGKEHILSEKEQGELVNEAVKNGLQYREYVDNYNRNVPMNHTALADKYLKANRNVTITVSVPRTAGDVECGPCDTAAIKRVGPERRIPGHPGYGFEIFPIPVPILRRKKNGVNTLTSETVTERIPTRQQQIGVIESPIAEPVAQERRTTVTGRAPSVSQIDRHGEQFVLNYNTTLPNGTYVRETLFSPAARTAPRPVAVNATTERVAVQPVVATETTREAIRPRIDPAEYAPRTRQERTMRNSRNKGKWRAAALVAMLPFVPVFSTKRAVDNYERPAAQCETYEVEQGARREIGVSTLLQWGIEKITGTPRSQARFDYGDNTKVFRVENPHKHIIEDEKGAVIETRQVPKGKRVLVESREVKLT